jgi:nucleotide-binding universal stress UspA family protein
MYNRILLTLDGSEMAEQALTPALGFAECFQSELFLLRVVSPLAKSYRAGAAYVAKVEAAEKALIGEADEYLNSIAAEIRENGMAVEVATRFGNPSKAIVEFVDQNEIDLVVMCTRGQTGPARWLLGSVVDHVVRTASIPVVAVPARITERQAADE